MNISSDCEQCHGLSDCDEMIRLGEHVYCIECLSFAVNMYKLNRNPLLTPNPLTKIGDMVFEDVALIEHKQPKVMERWNWNRR